MHSRQQAMSLLLQLQQKLRGAIMSANDELWSELWDKADVIF